MYKDMVSLSIVVFVAIEQRCYFGGNQDNRVRFKYWWKPGQYSQI